MHSEILTLGEGGNAVCCSTSQLLSIKWAKRWSVCACVHIQFILQFAILQFAVTGHSSIFTAALERQNASLYSEGNTGTMTLYGRCLLAELWPCPNGGYVHLPSICPGDQMTLQGLMVPLGWVLAGLFDLKLCLDSLSRDKDKLNLWSCDDYVKEKGCNCRSWLRV